MRKALREGGEVAPRPERQGKAEPNRERIILETRLCQGNLSLVHEELVKEGIDIGYSTVARFVHDNELLKAPKPPAGRYEFGPGVEMQFDTSPHRPKFKNGKRKCQCASLAFKYSHAFFFQYYPRFSRFEARVFLTEAARYFEGVCGRCIIDNSNVVLLHGTGENAVPCPEFEVFGKRFGFKFEAHEIGDKDRSGAVERPFHYYENNFLRKRVFENFPDLNAQARAWCDEKNGKYRKRLKTSPKELLVAELPYLKPLPVFIPEVYQLHQRLLDLEGYFHVHGNSYTAPYRLIGQTLEVRETIDNVTAFYKHQEVAAHEKAEHGKGARKTDKAHRPARGVLKKDKARPIPQEVALRQDSQVVDKYVGELKKRSVGRAIARLKRLDRMRREYPRDAFRKAVETALSFGMYDLARLENMILRNIAGDYFRIDEQGPSGADNDGPGEPQPKTMEDDDE